MRRFPPDVRLGDVGPADARSGPTPVDAPASPRRTAHAGPGRTTGRTDGRIAERAAARPHRAPAGLPVAQRGPLRLTARGRAVLLAAAAVLVTLVTLVVVLVMRLITGSTGSDEPAGAAAAAVAACVPDTSMSQNCWPAITDADDPRLVASPWITGKVLSGDVRTVLDHVAERFDAEVEAVDTDSSWGWAYRSVRGEDGEDNLSNHASGTSIDLNATEHPLGATGTFTSAQADAIRSILDEVQPVVAWGGDFDGRTDPMHFEIVGDADAVAEVAARLRGEAASD